VSAGCCTQRKKSSERLLLACDHRHRRSRRSSEHSMPEAPCSSRRTRVFPYAQHACPCCCSCLIVRCRGQVYFTPELWALLEQLYYDCKGAGVWDGSVRAVQKACSRATVACAGEALTGWLLTGCGGRKGRPGGPGAAAVASVCGAVAGSVLPTPARRASSPFCRISASGHRCVVFCLLPPCLP
jgi:hypothetical protein